MTYVRNSVLRQQGARPSAFLNLRVRARRAEASATAFRAGLETVQTITSAGSAPNGTTRKIARIVSEALA